MIKSVKGQQVIGQLEKKRGGYFFLEISAQTVEKFENKRRTRFLCTIQKQVTFPCGLNHLGNGNFFILISGKNLKEIGKKAGDNVKFELKEDPNPLGVEMPEVLKVLLDQDLELQKKFNAFTMGKKRHIIHVVKGVKNSDKQIQNAIKAIEVQRVHRRKNS